MTWANGPLSLYHGTVGLYADDIANNGIDLAKGRAGRDFGRGFYLTRREAQAIAWANEKYRKMATLHRYDRSAPHPNPGCAAVLHFQIDRNQLGSLDTLVFVSPDAEWNDFIHYCRTTMNGHKGPGVYYDAVHGPVSTVTNETTLRLDQTSFHSPAAIGFLHLINIRRGNPSL